MLRKPSLLIFSCLFFGHMLLSASTVNTEDYPAGMIEMKELIPDHLTTRTELKQLKKNEKHLQRVEKVMNLLHKMSFAKNGKHSSGLFSDPINRWMWLWLITWGFGILLLVVSAGAVSGAALGIIWLLAFAIGSIALILWLVKKFG
ncbi:MAG TPA: hypothetical protein VFG10_19570 [Saprospiraceae bacterium]|nr:hypothetical protein [Saprospiraceae bacterium]